MMMNFDGAQLRSEFKQAFGSDITDITPQQMMWMIKVMKHVRGRCRNNSALRNYLMRNFPGLLFKEVEREGKFGKFTTLAIHSKADQSKVATEEESATDDE